MKKMLLLIYLVFPCCFIACGDKYCRNSSTKINVEKQSGSENNGFDTQAEDDEKDKWQSEFNGPYLHKIHGLAGPYYEIENGKFRSIEIIGSLNGYFLAEIHEGITNLIEKSFFEIHHTKTTNPYHRYQVERLKLADFSRQKIDFLGLLKQGYINETGLFQAHSLITVDH